MDFKRKEPRKKLIAFTPVYELRRKTLLGFVADLTLQGALVTGETVLEAGAQFILGIEFPKDLLGISTTRMVIPARAAWCRRDDSPQGYNVGFEFTEVSDENKVIIEAVLARYQFHSASNLSDLES